MQTFNSVAILARVNFTEVAPADKETSIEILETKNRGKIN